MKYICEMCGAIIDEDELRFTRYYDSDLHFYYEEDNLCSCGGDYVEAHRCEICGEYHLEEDMNGDVCLNCLRENATIDNAFEAVENTEDNHDYAIPDFLVRIFGEPREIYTRLFNRLKEDNPREAKKTLKEWAVTDDAFVDYVLDNYKGVSAR